jgi:cell division septation protein DedD
MRIVLTCCVVIAAALLLSGCGQEEEITRTTADTTAVAPRRLAPQPPKAPEIESRTDTVNSVHREEGESGAGDSTGAQIRFMVQVGAFKDPQLASAIQTETRNRYHLPVLNDYFAALGLYQIRVGFFTTREEAHLFRQKMIDEFPADYKDSWVVQLRR